MDLERLITSTAWTGSQAQHAGHTENSRASTGQGGSPRLSFSLFIMIFTLSPSISPPGNLSNPGFLKELPKDKPRSTAVVRKIHGCAVHVWCSQTLRLVPSFHFI